MNTPGIIVFILSEIELYRLSRDVSRITIHSDSACVFVNNESDAVALINNVEDTQNLLLVTGASVGDAKFASKMKRKKPHIKVARLGVRGPIRKPEFPYDILVTAADPPNDYRTSFAVMVKEFLTRK